MAKKNETTQPNKGLTRRKFLLGAASVSVVAVGGGSYWATRSPEISFIETSYAQPIAEAPRVLVAYASQYGSTGGVADAIAQSCFEQGAAAEVRRGGNVSSVSDYDAVIVGAPVISDEWMPDARDFVKKHRAELSGRPVAYFLTCMTLALSTDEDERADQVKYLERIQQDFPEVTPIELGLFAGALDYGKMSPAMNVLYRVFSEDDTDGDDRDLPAIRAWASTLYPRLIGA
jgi:menaquinone-dependent protoporphyrinogen oxidase